MIEALIQALIVIAIVGGAIFYSYPKETTKAYRDTRKAIRKFNKWRKSRK